jgi:hypothetical protein
MSMFAGQLWANEAIAPSGETIGLLSGDQEKTILYTGTSKQDMMQHLAPHTYTLDWSGKVVQHS